MVSFNKKVFDVLYTVSSTSMYVAQLQQFLIQQLVK